MIYMMSWLCYLISQCKNWSPTEICCTEKSQLNSHPHKVVSKISLNVIFWQRFCEPCQTKNCILSLSCVTPHDYRDVSSGLSIFHCSTYLCWTILTKMFPQGRAFYCTWCVSPCCVCVTDFVVSSCGIFFTLLDFSICFPFIVQW